MNSITLHRKSCFLQQTDFKGKRGNDGGEPGGVEGLGRLKMCDLPGLPPTAIPRAQSLPQEVALSSIACTALTETCGDASR